jgi:hypothetical protein
MASTNISEVCQDDFTISEVCQDDFTISGACHYDGSTNHLGACHYDGSTMHPTILPSASNSAKTSAIFLPCNVATFRPHNASDSAPDE